MKTWAGRRGDAQHTSWSDAVLGTALADPYIIQNGVWKKYSYVDLMPFIAVDATGIYAECDLYESAPPNRHWACPMVSLDLGGRQIRWAVGESGTLGYRSTRISNRSPINFFNGRAVEGWGTLSGYRVDNGSWQNVTPGAQASGEINFGEAAVAINSAPVVARPGLIAQTCVRGLHGTPGGVAVRNPSKVLWRRRYDHKYCHGSLCMAPDGNTLYWSVRVVPENAPVEVISQESGLYAFDIMTGTVKWFKPYAYPALSMTATDDYVYVTMDGVLTGFSTINGEPHMVAPMEMIPFNYDQAHQDRVIGPAGVYASTLYTLTASEMLVARDARTGGALWCADVQLRGFTPRGAWAAKDDLTVGHPPIVVLPNAKIPCIVVVGVDGRVRLLDSYNGKTFWTSMWKADAVVAAYADRLFVTIDQHIAVVKSA